MSSQFQETKLNLRFTFREFFSVGIRLFSHGDFCYLNPVDGPTSMWKKGLAHLNISLDDGRTIKSREAAEILTADRLNVLNIANHYITY
jgi:hypothetical protein